MSLKIKIHKRILPLDPAATNAVVAELAATPTQAASKSPGLVQVAADALATINVAVTIFNMLLFSWMVKCGR